MVVEGTEAIGVVAMEAVEEMATAMVVAAMAVVTGKGEIMEVKLVLVAMGLAIIMGIKLLLVQVVGMVMVVEDKFSHGPEKGSNQLDSQGDYGGDGGQYGGGSEKTKVKQCDLNCNEMCDYTRIYISGLLLDITADDLRELFAGIGQGGIPSRKYVSGRSCEQLS